MQSYVYNATVVKVHDGDTLTLDVDLGFNVHMIESFRLFGCNARELSQIGGLEARDHLASLLPVGTPVQVESIKPDKFGNRYDGIIKIGAIEHLDLVQKLITEQWAAAWDGRGDKPVPPWPRTVTP